MKLFIWEVYLFSYTWQSWWYMVVLRRFWQVGFHDGLQKCEHTCSTWEEKSPLVSFTRKRLDHSAFKLSWGEKDSEIFRASGWQFFLHYCLQVSLQPIRQRGGAGQVPVQAVGGTWFDWCPHYQPHSSRQPAWFHTQHHHWQIQSPVFPAKRDPLWPAGAERRAQAAVPLRRLLCCWKSAGTVPTWADLSPDQRLFYPSGCSVLLSLLLPFSTFILSGYPSPQRATEK